MTSLAQEVVVQHMLKEERMFYPLFKKKPSHEPLAAASNAH